MSQCILETLVDKGTHVRSENKDNNSNRKEEVRDTVTRSAEGRWEKIMMIKEGKEEDTRKEENEQEK